MVKNIELETKVISEQLETNIWCQICDMSQIILEKVILTIAIDVVGHCIIVWECAY